MLFRLQIWEFPGFNDRLIKSTEQTIVTPISDNEFEIPEDGNKLFKQLLHVDID